MPARKFKKVLIANRGEIALRIQRACHKLGLKTVSIASEADKDSLFARSADELVIIGPARADQSYLAQDKIIKAAKEYGCDALHPGYGFLSENAGFAKKVTENGIKFIGPSAESIALLGSKTEARKRLSAAGIQCTPGSPGGLKDDELLSVAAEIHYPVLIKASAGGGGRGMRVAHDAKDLKEFLPRTRSEAEKFFGSPDVYLEKYIVKPRHVEVQVFGDSHGDVLLFGTRDCSTQRRHQKLIEEAPAPNLSPAIRERLHTAAATMVNTLKYQNAGTVEFLVSGEMYYFLEVNTRIQVEHPVTEVVTGVDLVELQLLVAMGEKFPIKQSQVNFSGHAIEFRIYAEDPSNNFSPAKGKLARWKVPEFPWVREDRGFAEGDQVSLHYDALLSKLIVHGASREEALVRSRKVFSQYKLEGVTNTVPFHRWLLNQPEFVSSPVDIGFIEREFKADSLNELSAIDLRDPAHAIGTREQRQYHSKRFKADYLVQIEHVPDGLFLATPLFAGRVAPNTNCRASNSREAAYQALIDDLLEVLPPDQVCIG